MLPRDEFCLTLSNHSVTLLSRKNRAFTLIELLCVIAIIGILMGLMLPTLSKVLKRVHAFQGEFEIHGFIEEVQERFTRFREGTAVHPALTLPQLNELGVLDQRHLVFIKRNKIKFVPFASTDPDTNIVLLGTQKATLFQLTKGDFVRREPVP